MKTYFKFTLAAVLLLTMQLAAQTTAKSLDNFLVLPSSASAAPAPDVINLSNYQIQDSYIQSFRYYDNEEIRKLETEVSRHSNLYRRDQYRQSNYTATKYSDLSENEKKDFRNSASNFDREVYYSRTKKEDDNKDKTLDQRAEEYFNRMIVPYLNSDGSVNKQKLSEVIKTKVNQIFELKESLKQKEVQKLEEQLKNLQNTLSERRKNKNQIVQERLNDLLGLPSNLRW